jgi:F-type H+-transporting ATPase subunit epsilon
MAEHRLLTLTIARVDAPVFNGEVASVTVPGIGGEMTILANHAPLISPLKSGVIMYRVDQKEETVTIEGGTLEISNNHATILI